MKSVIVTLIAACVASAQVPLPGPIVGGGGGGGGVTSVATTGPLSGGTITSTGTLSCPTCVTSAASLTSLGTVVGGGSQTAQTSSQFVVSNLGTPGTETWTQTNTGLGTTPAGGHVLANSTAAAVGAQQVSPPSVWSGSGWKTTATAGPQAVAFQAYVLPVQGTTSPTGTWILQSSINGGAFANAFILNTGMSATTPGIALGANNNTGISTTGNNVYMISGSTTMVDINNNSTVLVRNIGAFAFNSGNLGAGSADTILTRFAAATIQHGAADAAAPVAQTIRMQSVVAGTSNTAGAAAIFQGSIGTGTGVGGDILLKVAPASTTGSTQNAAVTALTISGTYGIPVAGSVLFAALPAATNGGFIYCSDCTIAATCAGAGTGAFAKRLNAVWVCN